MNTRINKFILLVLLFSFVSGCSKKDYEDKSVEENKYITFTVTYDDGNLKSQIYCFDLSDERVEYITEIPYTSKYPLTVYDKDHNIIYYSSNDGISHSDQLYQFELNTHTETKLTENLYAINAIIPYDNEIFLAAAEKQKETYMSVHPWLYSQYDDNLKHLTSDDDLNVVEVNMDPETSEIVFSGHSISELYQALDAQMEHDYIEIDHCIYILVDNTYKEIFRTKNERIITLAVNRDAYYYSTDSKEIWRIDKVKKERNMLISDEHHLAFDSIIYITNDERYIYYISGNDLIKYSQKNRKKYNLYRSDKEQSKINNAMIFSSKH